MTFLRYSPTRQGQPSHKGHDVPACRADAVSCPFDWPRLVLWAFARDLSAGQNEVRGPVTSGRTCGPDVWSDVRSDVWPDIRAAAQSMRPGPTLGQLLESVVWAAAQGRETRRTGWGRKDGPGHEPCARAGTGRRQLGTWFQGQLKAASRTGNQKRQIRTGGQGKWPGTDAQNPWSEASGKRCV